MHVCLNVHMNEFQSHKTFDKRCVAPSLDYVLSSFQWSPCSSRSYFQQAFPESALVSPTRVSEDHQQESQQHITYHTHNTTFLNRLHHLNFISKLILTPSKTRPSTSEPLTTPFSPQGHPLHFDCNHEYHEEDPSPESPAGAGRYTAIASASLDR